MDNEPIEFRAGRDTYGLVVWAPALVIGREDRDDGEWLNVLPKNSASEDEARWVHHDDVRSSTPQR